MEIGKKLKNARVQSGMTQENVAEKINVSRQTISNWENEKSYPDIISVIELSNLYSISLDELLKGDEKMIEHLEESTNVVKSNQKMIWAIIVNIIVVALLITLNMFIPDNRYFLVGIFRHSTKIPLFCNISIVFVLAFARSFQFSSFLPKQKERICTSATGVCTSIKGFEFLRIRGKHPNSKSSTCGSNTTYLFISFNIQYLFPKNLAIDVEFFVYVYYLYKQQFYYHQ